MPAEINDEAKSIENKDVLVVMAEQVNPQGTVEFVENADLLNMCFEVIGKHPTEDYLVKESAEIILDKKSAKVVAKRIMEWLSKRDIKQDSNN